MPRKTQLTNWQMFNINFGYLGVQLSWALQIANISGIFKFLGASDDQIPILWLAGPVTGLLIPPIIGFVSDHTWVNYLGRRRFYILIGTILAALSLFAIPNTRSLTHAVLLVWLLDSGLNIAMHPYRALIADKTPVNQQTKCFSILTAVSCIGSAIAFIMPWLLAFYYKSYYDFDTHSIPPTIETAFLFGALLLLCTNFWTVFSTTESKDLSISSNKAKNKRAFKFDSFSNIRSSLKEQLYIPDVMRDLVRVEFFTWIGFFSFIIYYALGVSQNLFGLPEGAEIINNIEYTILLKKGVELCGLHSFLYIIIGGIFVLLLSFLCKYFERKKIYATCLVFGAIGLIMTDFAASNQQLAGCVILVGLAWGAAVTIPFAILSSGVPKDRVGWYMGYYNFFVVIPQIIVSCTFGYIIRVLFADHAMSVVSMGGGFMLIGAFFALRIKDPYKHFTSTISPTSQKLLTEEVDS